MAHRALHDRAQLSPVDAGGAFGLLARDRTTSMAELGDIRRFNSEWERTASIEVRHGHQTVLDTYQSHDRITGGIREDLLETAYTTWKNDVDVGQVKPHDRPRHRQTSSRGLSPGAGPEDLADATLHEVTSFDGERIPSLAIAQRRGEPGPAVRDPRCQRPAGGPLGSRAARVIRAPARPLMSSSSTKTKGTACRSWRIASKPIREPSSSSTESSGRVSHPETSQRRQPLWRPGEQFAARRRGVEGTIGDSRTSEEALARCVTPHVVSGDPDPSGLAVRSDRQLGTAVRHDSSACDTHRG